MKKVLAICLMFAMLLSMATFAIPASAANAVTDATVGRKFTSDDAVVMDGTLGKAPRTYEVWVKVPTGGATGNVFSTYMRDSGRYATDNARVKMFIDSNGAPNLQWYDEIKTLYEVDFDKVNVKTGAWTHIAIVHEDNGSFTCYINGTRYVVSNKYYNSTTVFESFMTYPTLDDEIFEVPIAVGGSNERGNAEPFTGEIAGFTMYADARTAAEVKADMTAVNANDADLLASYDLSQTSVDGYYKNLKADGIDLIDGKQWLTESEMEVVRSQRFDDDFERAYSFVVVGDTQMTTKGAPDKLPILYQWIKDNVDDKNIQYVMGVGDITDNDVAAEWNTAYNAITILDGAVDYSLVTGNHDYYVDGKSFDKLFAEHEPYASQFTDGKGGLFKEGSVLNTWRYLTMGKTEYILFNLEWGPSDAVLKWASAIVEANPDKKIIITTHSYLYPNATLTDDDDTGSSAYEMFPDSNLGTDRDNNNGDDIWNEFVSKYENIEMVICGHEMSENIVVNHRKGEKGNTVTEMLINPQGIDVYSPVGKGIIAILYFNEDGTKCELEYYSTVLDKYYKTNNQLAIDFTEEGEAEPAGWNGSFEEPKGSGTKRDPYLISSGGHLMWMAEMCDTAKTLSPTDADPNNEQNAHFDGMYFKQTCDIDLNGHTIQTIGYAATNWKSLGAFGGTYDGGGYKIYNGKVSPAFTGKPVNRYYGFGLFAAIYGANIMNLTLDNLEITGQGVTGGLVGIAYAPETAKSPSDFNRISNCHITNTCKINTHFTHDRTYDKAIANDNDYQVGLVGGIVARAMGTTIEYCSSDIEIEVGATFSNVGGIVSHAGYNSVVDHCKFTGGITLKDNAHNQTTAVGGIVGSISPQYSTAFANATAANLRGMLIVRNCYNSGYFKYTGTSAISGRNQVYGGIVGSFNYIPKAVAGTEAEPYPFLIENSYNLYARECESILSNCKYILQAGIAGKGLSSNATNHGILYLKNCYSVDVDERYRQGMTEEFTGTNEYTHEITVGSTKRYDCLKILDNSVGTKTADEIKVYTDAIDKEIAECSFTFVGDYKEPSVGAAPDFSTAYTGTTVSKNALLVTKKVENASNGCRVVESWEGKDYMFYTGINAFTTFAEAYAYCNSNGIEYTDIICTSVDPSSDLDMTVPSRVYAPNFDTKPYVNPENFDATKDYDTPWTDNADYMDSQVIINDIIFNSATSGEKVGVYGFTFTGVIIDTKRPKNNTPTEITVKNVMKDGASASNRAYIYQPTNSNTNYDSKSKVAANAAQQDKVDIINLYIKSTHTQARLIGEYTSAYTTFDGLCFDGVKSGMNNDITYLKQAADKSVFTIKNSYITNWRKDSLSKSQTGPLSMSGRSGVEIEKGQYTELCFDNNVIKNLVSRTDGGTGAYVFFFYPGAFSDFTFTNNFLEMPKNPVTGSLTSSFIYSGTTFTADNCDNEAFNDVTITDNMFVGVSRSFSIGSNGQFFANFNFVVRDNYSAQTWVDDFTNTVSSAVVVDSRHKRGGGETVYYYDSAMTEKSNQVQAFTFADGVSVDGNDITVDFNTANGKVTFDEETGKYTYEYNFKDIVASNPRNNKLSLEFNGEKYAINDTVSTWSKMILLELGIAKLVVDAPVGTEDTKTYNIKVVNHFTYEVEGKDATCTESGNKGYWVCEHCGEFFADRAGVTKIDDLGAWLAEGGDGYIPAAHTLTDVDAKDATCTEDGYTAHKACANCDYKEGFEVIPASHALADVDGKDATCTEDGYTAHKACTKCDYKENYEVIPAGHKWSEWIYNDDATVVADGTETRTCSACGESETRTAEGTRIPSENEDPTYRPDHHMPFLTLNEAGNAVVLDQNKSWATRVYWGNIGDTQVDYKWFDEDFRLLAGTDYFADYSPQDGEVYNFTKPGWYRFVVKAIRTGLSAEDYTYSELLFDYYYDGKTLSAVPSIETVDSNTVQVNANGNKIVKLYYGNIGQTNTPYSWFNDFWGKALGTKTYTADFDVKANEQYTLMLKGYYNFVIVYEDANGVQQEIVYTAYADKNASIVKMTDAKAVVDLAAGMQGGTIKKLYYAYIGTENTEYQGYDHFKANYKVAADSQVTDGKSYNLSQKGYYRFVIQYTVQRTDHEELYHTYDVVVTVFNAPGAEPVATATDLANAIAEGKDVYLYEDVVVNQNITVPAGADVTIDLGGNTLAGAFSNAGASALITNKGTLTIKNGTVVSLAQYPDVDWGEEGFPTYATNTISNQGTLVLGEGAHVENQTNVGGASYAVDNYAGGTLTVNDGAEVVAKDVAIRMFAGSATADNKVVINGGTITGKRAVWVQLAGSNSAVAPKVTLEINGGVLNATSEFAIYSYSFGNSFANTNVTITGGTFEAGVAFGGGYKGDKENVTVTGGTFNSFLGRYLENDGWEDIVIAD